MSLDGFYRGLAAMASNPDLVRRSRDGDHDWLHTFDLSVIELDRLKIMAGRDGMEVMCSVYRSNRLTALIGTVPAVVAGLGDRLGPTVSDFWVATPRSDMQFRTEGAAFCDFVRARFPHDSPLRTVIAAAEVSLIALYDQTRIAKESGDGAPATESGRRLTVGSTVPSAW